MANIVPVFQFIKNEFKVVEIDIDNTIGVETAEDATLQVCNPKRDVMESVMSEHPGIYQFFIDTADLESVETFNRDFKIAAEDEHIAEDVAE